MTYQPPQEFWQGVAQFNQRQFYACHDTLEAVWLEAPEFYKTFYQGILQVAVALYHLSNQNWQGAVILLGEGVKRLSNYEYKEFGLNLENLMAESLDILTDLQNIAPEQVGLLADHLGLINEEILVTSDLTFSCHLPTINFINESDSNIL
jgi:uncharacterized protein